MQTLRVSQESQWWSEMCRRLASLSTDEAAAPVPPPSCSPTCSPAGDICEGVKIRNYVRPGHQAPLDAQINFQPVNIGVNVLAALSDRVVAFMPLTDFFLSFFCFIVLFLCG